MEAVSFRVLMAGSPTPSTDRLIVHLTARGYGAQRVETLAQATSVMKDYRFAVVLATESLPDGSGYELGRLVERQSGSLFVAIPLSETLWLPVVERGAIVLGQRALNASLFENEVEIALGAARAEIKTSGKGKACTIPRIHQRVATPRRRSTEAA